MPAVALQEHYRRNARSIVFAAGISREVAKRQFRWRNPAMNPYIVRDEERSTVTSRYRDVAMAMGHSLMESRMR